MLPAQHAGMLAVFIRRGLWGHLHAHRPEINSQSNSPRLLPRSLSRSGRPGHGRSGLLLQIHVPPEQQSVAGFPVGDQAALLFRLGSGQAVPCCVIGMTGFELQLDTAAWPCHELQLRPRSSPAVMSGAAWFSRLPCTRSSGYCPAAQVPHAIRRRPWLPAPRMPNGRVAAVTEPWLYHDPLVPVDRRCEHAAAWTTGCRDPGDLAPAMRAFVNREDLDGPVSAAS